MLHNLRFIQWKPTVFFWLASLAFLASFWLGRHTLTQRLLGAAFSGEDARVPEATWRRLNTLWVLFYALLGGLNLLVAFNFSEHVWVDFKVIGLPVVNFLFAGGQIAWLMRRFAGGTHEPSPQP